MEVMQEKYKDTKLGRIPIDYNPIKLGTLCKVIVGGTPSTEKKEYWNGNIPWLASGELKNNLINNSKKKITELGLKQSATQLMVKNTVLLAMTGATLGRIGYLEVESCGNQSIAGFLPNENYVSKYLFYHLQYHNRLIFSYAAGAAQPGINKKNIESLLFLNPPLFEQQKIAAIFSMVDEQISATEKIIEKSKELKKGLMQQLFSEGIGHTEFKDTKIGRIPKDWEVVKIGDVAKIKVGRDLKEDAFSTIKTKTHKYPVFSNTVSGNGFYGGYYNFAEYEGNCLTIVGRGVGIGTSFSRKGGFGAIGRLLVLFPKDGIDEVFMSYFVNHRMTIFYEDGGIPQLTGDKISKYKVAKPQLLEQQKIAAILSEADAKIEKEQTQKAQLEALKKGLMQQLLTGKKRVKV